MMKHKLYSDQDGVFADFAKPAAEFFNVDFSGWVSLSAEDWGRYRNAHPNMWENIPLMPYARELWNAIVPYRPDILTAVPHQAEWHDVGLQKLTWFKRHFPDFASQLYAVQREDKQQFAQQEDGTPNILIDDMQKNIDEWQNAGGIGIFYNASPEAVENVQRTLATYF